MEFTIVDAGVGVIAFVSGLLAYSRGFTRELFAIAGWIVAAIAAFYGAPALEPLIRELPVVGKVLADSCIISMIAAFTIVVAAALLVLSVFTPMIAGLVLDSPLGSLDRLLGFIFGIARGLLLIAVAFLIYTEFSGAGSFPQIDNAASHSLFEESSALITENLPENLSVWIGQKIDALMVNCGDVAPAATSPETGNVGTGTEVPTTGTTGN
ncbi:MAG TPA: CvpA family protein [Thermohalobaculum sp.]|nr:CvpA family protein [Thermohalobaculum sp.]